MFTLRREVVFNPLGLETGSVGDSKPMVPWQHFPWEQKTGPVQYSLPQPNVILYTPACSRLFGDLLGKHESQQLLRKLLYSNFQIKSFHFIGNCVETQNVLRQDGTSHQGSPLCSKSKPLQSFRMSLKLTRFSRSLPPQEYISSNGGWEMLSDKQSCLEAIETN